MKSCCKPYRLFVKRLAHSTKPLRSSSVPRAVVAEWKPLSVEGETGVGLHHSRRRRALDSQQSVHWSLGLDTDPPVSGGRHLYPTEGSAPRKNFIHLIRRFVHKRVILCIGGTKSPLICRGTRDPLVSPSDYNWDGGMCYNQQCSQPYTLAAWRSLRGWGHAWVTRVLKVQFLPHY